MKKIIHQTILSLLFILTGLTSCDNSGNDESPYVKGPKDSAILIYAVATNNLYGNLISDKQEMLMAARDIDLKNNDVYLYQTTLQDTPSLLKITSDGDVCSFETVREYSNSLSSLDPERISNVISEFRNLTDASTYGLVLWSHGTGIDPYNGGYLKDTEGSVQMYSFGYDRDPDNTSVHYELNVDELADAIPDNFFRFIWFDACYMAGIETIYELRDKCDFFVGYPTEVFEMGVPYNLVLPYLTQKEPDLKGGAQSFFNYYALHSNPSARVATVALVNMARLEELADYCSYIFRDYTMPGNVYSLQKYSRSNTGPFYDLGQYLAAVSSKGEDKAFSEDFRDILDRVVTYREITDKDFNGYPFDVDNYSGLSCHVYYPGDTSAKETYFRTLDWFKRVFEN